MRRLDRRQDALAASGRRERAHVRPAPRRAPRPPRPRRTSACSAPGMRLSIAYESPSRARKRKPDPHSDRHLDRLQPDPEREALGVRHAVRARAGARPRPGRAPRSPARAGRASPRSSARARARRPAAARGCRTPASPPRPRSSWHEPADALEHRRDHRRHRLVQHAQPVTRHRHEPADTRPPPRASGGDGAGRSPRANANSAKATTTAIARLVNAQCGIFAVKST